MPLYLWERFGPCPERIIEEFEDARSIRVPPLLREFLLCWDGAEVNEDQSEIQCRDRRSPVSEILPARVLGFRNVEHQNPTIPEVTQKLRELIPRSGVPFLQDVFGAYLIVDSDSMEVDFVNLDPSEDEVGVGCFPTGLWLADFMAEIREGNRET